MTESEWLVGCDYRGMYRHIHGHVNTRKARLCMAACCWLHEVAFTDYRVIQAVETAERCADDPDAEDQLIEVQREFVHWLRAEEKPVGARGTISRSLHDIWELLYEWNGSPHYVEAGQAIAHAAYILTGGAGDAVEYCARAIDLAEVLSGGGEIQPDDCELNGPELETQTKHHIANLLRDLFGNPFRSVEIHPSWETPLVEVMAGTAYRERDWVCLPVLADVLEDAGCSDSEVLHHLRGPGPHVRGCWVLDLILGKK
jgi:hypothetical protein